MAFSANVRHRIQDPEVRRAHILEEAIGIIGARGYSAFAIQDVAKRCGLTNGGLLYHFPSKELLLLAVLEERDRRLTHDVVTDVGPERLDGSPDSTIGLLRGIIQRVAAQPALARLYAVLQGEALDPDHPAHGYFVAREKSTLASFTALVSRHVADPQATARHVHALIDGLVLQWLRAGQGFDIVAAWDEAIASFGWMD
jgi:AcrR family transcriptional regulator